MTGEIQNLYCVVLIVSHVTLQMSRCYETDHACLKYLYFFALVSSLLLFLLV